MLLQMQLLAGFIQRQNDRKATVRDLPSKMKDPRDCQTPRRDPPSRGLGPGQETREGSRRLKPFSLQSGMA